MTQQEITIPDLINTVGGKLLQSGANPSDLVSALIGYAIGLTLEEIGAERTRKYIADVAIKIDEDLQNAH